MYTDNIDEILDDILNKAYTDGKKLCKTSSTKTEIDKFMKKFMNSYKNDMLNHYKDETIKKALLDIYEKYVLMYVLINVCNNYKDKDFANYLLTFKRNAIFNSTVVNIKHTVNQLLYISKNIKNIKENKVILDNTYKNSIKIFNELGDMFTSNLKSQDIYHSIIKYILYKQSFLMNDKVIIYGLIEEYELGFLESKIIEIIKI